MFRIIKLTTNLVVALTILFIGCTPQIQEDDLQSIISGTTVDLSHLKVPTFPEYAVSIKGFGAVGDGETLNTEAFAKAIDAVSEAGGGTVVVPPGIWLTGPIQFKNNIRLHTERGSMILFSPDLEEYPLIETYWEGQEEVRRMSPLSGFDLENIAITGLGVFDGNGDAWRKVKRFKLTPNQWSQLLKSGGVVDKKDVWWPSEAAMNGEKTVERLKAENAPVEAYEQVGRYARPVLLSFVKCKGILLDGPTFQNSAAWNLHPLMCEDLIIRNITVRNPWFSANGDGLDLESCKNAVIYNCSFDVGDDAICIKSGRNAYGRERGIPTENVIIADNVVYHGHGGVVVGSEMSGGVRNIDVRRQTFIGTDVGLRFKSTRGRGGVVENIFIKDIQMTNIPAEAIRFNLFYQSKSPLPESEEDMGKALFGMPSAEPVTEETPQFKNITMENIICRGAGRAIMLQGLPEMTLKNVHLKNVDMTATKGVVCVDAEGIQMENVTLSVAKGPGFILINSYNIDASGLELIQDQPKVLINGERTSDIKLTEALEAVATIGKEVGSLN